MGAVIGEERRVVVLVGGWIGRWLLHVRRVKRF